ncbi:MAG: hypothetical protein ABSE87_08545 [Terracidiphilus sp.]|jgi:hypothetical protein
MKPSPILEFLLSCLAKILVAVGGLSFLVGGGLIHAETHMSRLSAELVGMGIAAACILFGLLARKLAGILNPKQEDTPIKLPN